MRTFVVVRDELDLRTVLCREVVDKTSAAALRDALVRYPDPDRYGAVILYGRDWPSVALSYPRYADAKPDLVDGKA